MGGGSGGSGSGNGTQTNYIRYAPYIEDRHTTFLANVANYRTLLVGDSPYSSFEDIDVDTAFLGAGVAITSFSSLFDSYETLLLNYDIESAYNTIFEQVTNSQHVSDLISAQAADLNYEIENETLPRFMIGARDVNAVVSSTFVIGKSLIEAEKVRNLSKFSAELRYKLIPVVFERWKTTLDWNKVTIEMYAQIFKLYFAAKMDEGETNFEMAVKDKLWPFTVLDYERAALGALQGATNSKSVGGSETSKVQKALGGAMSGAAMGAQLSGGNPIGAAVGGVLGLAGGFL